VSIFDNGYLRLGHCKRYRATGPQRATGPESTWTWLHPQAAPNHVTLCDRSAQGSKSWHSGSFAKYSDIGLVTISFQACCVSHRATGLPVIVHDMHRRRRPHYLQACPTEPPVDGVKSALTSALWPCTFCSDPSYLVRFTPIWSDLIIRVTENPVGSTLITAWPPNGFSIIQDFL